MPIAKNILNMNGLDSPMINSSSSPQCQYFVIRKKRLCRMTVKPGRQYCGEHEPEPKTDSGKEDTRIPCPFDSKHTCYASKLEKHLSICNARNQEQPEYIVQNINIPLYNDGCPRLPLSQILSIRILNVIDKVNVLYEKHLKDAIETLSEQPIHSSICKEFNETGRTESSLRHLRQASRLLHLVEQEGLVNTDTCYVELGAGKGQLSYYAWWAWCREHSGRVLLVDRASLRHKRDNKLRDSRYTPNEAVEELNSDVNNNAHRIRADLAHLRLERVPAVQASARAVGLAKHLCGVATDYALRCITSQEVLHKVAGLVLATCCHHRCERPMFIANSHLQKLGITADDFNIIVGIVSWATCGDGRSRQKRNEGSGESPDGNTWPLRCEEGDVGTKNIDLGQEQREMIGRRAKALLDYARVLYLRDCGFDARLVYYVPTSVSLENVCIFAKRKSNVMLTDNLIV